MKSLFLWERGRALVRAPLVDHPEGPLRMPNPFRRVLVKISGEALAAPDGYWLHPQTLAALAGQMTLGDQATIVGGLGGV